jgi:hypothetical protein
MKKIDSDRRSGGRSHIHRMGIQTALGDAVYNRAGHRRNTSTSEWARRLNTFGKIFALGTFEGFEGTKQESMISAYRELDHDECGDSSAQDREKQPARNALVLSAHLPDVTR